MTKRPDWGESWDSKLPHAQTFRCPYHGTFHSDTGDQCPHCRQESEDDTRND